MLCQHGWCLNGLHVYRICSMRCFFLPLSLLIPAGGTITCVGDSFFCQEYASCSTLVVRPGHLSLFLNSGPHGGAEGSGLWIFFFLCMVWAVGERVVDGAVDIPSR